MLTAADTTAGAGGLAEQFRQQTPDIARKRYIMTMTTMIGKDKILFLQLSGKGQSRKFLTHAGVNGSVQLAQREKLQELLFHPPDAKRLTDDTVVDRYSI